jgi:hypothetical protein
MSFIQGPLESTTLPEIAEEIYNAELDIQLADLTTRNEGGTWNNYAIHDDPADTPLTGIEILAAPAVGPDGSTPICNGTLTIDGRQMPVTAFRLAQ